MRIDVDMHSIDRILKDHGLDSNGYVQKYVTFAINKYLTEYMPFQTGTLATKLKFITSPTKIEVLSPAAKYLYCGKRMVNSKTGKGPALIPDVGYRYRKGTILMPTDEPLNYDTTKNAKAGPYWDKRMMAERKQTIANETMEYIRRRG